MKNYIQQIIDAFTSSRHSKEVTNDVQHWLVDGAHADEKEQALRKLWNETEGKADAGTWRSLQHVYERLGIIDPQRRRYNLWGARYAAAAVALFFIVSATFFWTRHITMQRMAVNMVEQYIPNGKTEWVELPDGSRAHINSGTTLLYPDVFRGETRTVYLIGEADFKVKKNPNRPFIVRSANMAVTALGTEFNVEAYPEDEEIVATLIDGKVSVNCHGESQDDYILTPGQQVIYNRKTNESRKVNAADIEEVTAWQRGRLVFRGNTMPEIVNALERRYGVLFQYSTDLFSGDKYNFSFERDATLPEVLNVIKIVTGRFNYTIKGKVCYMHAFR